MAAGEGILVIDSDEKIRDLLGEFSGARATAKTPP